LEIIRDVSLETSTHATSARGVLLTRIPSDLSLPVSIQAVTAIDHTHLEIRIFPQAMGEVGYVVLHRVTVIATHLLIEIVTAMTTAMTIIESLAAPFHHLVMKIAETVETIVVRLRVTTLPMPAATIIAH